MIDVDLPAGPAPETVRAMAACLASMTGTALEDLPVPTASGVGLDEALAVWRTYLVGRGAGLVEINAPNRFAWPGPWLALAAAPSGGPERAVVAFGTPSGVALSPADASLLGRATADLVVARGWVVAALEATLPVAPPPAAVLGRVEVLAIAAAARGPMREVSAVRALAGRGLAGDRYAASAGTFTSKTPGGGAGGYDLTLIAGEVLDQVRLPDGRALAPSQARRNVVTRGVDLDALIGRRFYLGEVECVGRRRCEPCAHLEALASPGVLRDLVHLGGLRADVVSEGEITVGATITAAD